MLSLLDLFENIRDAITIIENQSGVKILGTENGSCDIPVVISLSEPSIGPIATSDIIGAHLGFDWDSGNFIIYPEKELVSKIYANKKTKKRKSNIFNNKNEEIYFCENCLKTIGVSDKFCKHCGKEFVYEV